MNIDLRFGDDIERLHREWISANVPEYELLWSRFIGHDGCGRPLNVHLTTLSSEDRERFFQAHYSALLSILALKDIAVSYEQKLGQVENALDYLAANRDLVGFTANLGRLRDLFQKMDGVLGLGSSVANKFDDLYSQRNSVLHGPIPSHKIENGLLMIPVPAIREAVNDWTDEGLWADADKYRFVFITDFFNETLEKALNHFRAGISCYLDRLKELEPQLAQPLQVNREVPVSSTNSTALSSVSGQYSAVVNVRS